MIKPHNLNEKLLFDTLAQNPHAVRLMSMASELGELCAALDERDVANSKKDLKARKRATQRVALSRGSAEVLLRG